MPDPDPIPHRPPDPSPKAPGLRGAGRPPDRRSGTPLNRLRRFVNNYWLVPVVVVYLQLLAALLNVQGSGESGLLARNRVFFQGIPLTIQILARDFPYAVIGHAKEITYHWGGGDGAASPIEVAEAVRGMRREIHEAILASQARRDTEVGGLVMLTSDGRVALHPVPSSNGALVRSLEAMAPEAAVAALLDPANRPVVEALAGSVKPARRIQALLEDPDVRPAERERAYSAFLYSLEVASESRYMVVPMVFKSTLGHLPEWRLLGIYHFHNEVDLPPSDADVAASAEMRQFVFTLAEDGFQLYDLHDGRATVSLHAVDPGTPPPRGAPRRV